MLIQPVDYFLVAWFILAFACTAASTDRSPGGAAWPAACSLRREERTGERDRRPRKAPRPVSGALLSQPSPHRSSERFGSNHLLSPRLTARASVSARTIYSALASPPERAFPLELPLLPPTAPPYEEARDGEEGAQIDPPRLVPGRDLEPLAIRLPADAVAPARLA